MRKNQIIKIFQDGKICRDAKATIVGLRAGGIQVRFTPMTEDEEIVVWCRRRRLGGKYEAHGWNYWILPLFSEHEGSVHDLVMRRDMELINKISS